MKYNWSWSRVRWPPENTPGVWDILKIVSTNKEYRELKRGKNNKSEETRDHPPMSLAIFARQFD